MKAYVGPLRIYKDFKTVGEMEGLIIRTLPKIKVNIRKIRRKADTATICFDKNYRTINFEVMTDEKLPTGAYFRWNWDFVIID